MKTILCAAMLLLAVATSAMGDVPYLNPHVWTAGALGASPDPKQTVQIADNYSHNIPITNQIWYDLWFNGTSGCIVRLMNTTTKASWPAEPVQAYSRMSYLLHSNVKYLNYSGCYGSASVNSILHLQ